MAWQQMPQSGQPLVDTKGIITRPWYLFLNFLKSAIAALGTLAAGQIAVGGSSPNTVTGGNLSGDVSTSGSTVTTLATVNASPGTYGDSTHVAQVTVNAKGLATTVSNVAIAAAAGGGTMGPPGRRGEDGARGRSIPGQPGAAGAAGSPGAAGATGPPGFGLRGRPGEAGRNAWTALGSPPQALSSIGITVDGGGATLTTGTKGFVQVPRAGTIVAATLLSTDASATSGSIVFDVWKDTFANYPPTVADTITASAKPTLSSQQSSQDTTLTGWTRSFSANDVFGFHVDSVTTLTRVTLQLTVLY